MTTFPTRAFTALLLLAGLAASAEAQTSTKSSAATREAATEAPTAAPVKSGVPEGNGRWVPRVDKQTCPKGSETYIDEKDGGVKCWVSSANTN